MNIHTQVVFSDGIVARAYVMIADLQLDSITDDTGFTDHIMQYPGSE